MADIFISYKSIERPIVARIAEALREAGFTVWWDHALVGGQDYSEVIRREIADARVVMPVWSAESVQSQWVRAEADEGADRLFPVLIDNVRPPLPYNKLHTINLVGWSGDRNDPRWVRLVADLRATLTGEKLAAPAPAAPPRRRAPLLLVGAALVAAAGVAAVVVLTGRDAPPEDGPQASAALAPAPVPAPAVAAATADPVVSIDICAAASDATCGLSKVKIGDVVTLRVSSRISGRLILIDESADGQQMQVFPNGLTDAAGSLTIAAGQALWLPNEDHEFRYEVGGPAGQSRILATVLPAETALPSIVEENRRTRGIVPVPRERRGELEEVIATIGKEAGAAAGHAALSYEVLP